MKIRTKKTTYDYREALEKFKAAKEVGTAYMTYDYTTRLYTVELWQETNSQSEFYRAILSNINTNIAEEQDALSYADSAIKTLVDMGVLE